MRCFVSSRGPLLRRAEGMEGQRCRSVVGSWGGGLVWEGEAQAAANGDSGWAGWRENRVGTRLRPLLGSRKRFGSWGKTGTSCPSPAKTFLERAGAPSATLAHPFFVSGAFQCHGQPPGQFLPFFFRLAAASLRRGQFASEQCGCWSQAVVVSSPAKASVPRPSHAPCPGVHPNCCARTRSK